MEKKVFDTDISKYWYELILANMIFLWSCKWEEEYRRFYAGIYQTTVYYWNCIIWLGEILFFLWNL